MTLIGRSPVDRHPYPGLNHIVHGHQVRRGYQGHETGNELTVSLYPMIDADVAILERFRPDVSNHVLWKAIEFRREIFPVHFQTPARLLVLSHPENGHHAPQLVRESTEIGLAFRSQYNYEVRA